MARRAHAASSIPPPMPGGVRCAPKQKGRARAEHSRQSYEAALRELRALLLAVDAFDDEGFDPDLIRRRWYELRATAHKASGTLAHLDALDASLWGDTR